jgi:hypothetical protein
MEVYILRQGNVGVVEMSVWYLLDHARLSSDCMTATNSAETSIEIRFLYSCPNVSFEFKIFLMYFDIWYIC